MTVKTFSRDFGKRFLLEKLPWALGFLPALRGKGLKLRFQKDRILIIDPKGRRQIWLNRENAVYVPDMFNYFEYYFNAVEPFRQPSLSGGHLIVDYSSQRTHRVTGFPDFPIHCPSLVEPYQTCQQYLQFAQLAEGQTVLDLGCYSGLTAIAFSNAVKKSGRVISLEPDPDNFAACLHNFDLHSRVTALKNITLLPLAAAGKTGTLRFSSEGSMGSSSVSYVGEYRGAVLEVPCITLEDLVKEHDVERVDFIKMDIEGSELDVLRSASSFFRKHRPRLIIEAHVVSGKLNADEIIDCLTGYNYRCNKIEQWGVSLPLVTAVPC